MDVVQNQDQTVDINSFHDVFEAVKAYCKEHSSQVSYNTFIADLKEVSFEGGKAVIAAPNDFKKGIVEDKFLDKLEKGFQSVLGFDIEIELESTEKKVPILATGSYDYTFENFIVGPNNKFAHAAALGVATKPSESYNPLFIWGPSGLGKTHLLHAIQHKIAADHPDYVICYVDGDRFTNEIIIAIQEKRMSDFHDKYRTADVLLVDDIQFIAGKESTQEEFFHTFNTLHTEGKQIVLASDRTPKDIRSLDERLRTRFEQGLIADINPPDFETRVAIIRRKAALLNLNITNDVADYIANNLKDNIRQLEGAVKKFNAHVLLGDAPVLSTAQHAINDIISTETRPIPETIEKIVTEVARTYNVTPEDIRSKKRNQNVSNARMVAMYCVRDITDQSMERIGQEFGNRDHSTVTYAIHKVTELMTRDTLLRETIEDIIKNVRG